MGFFSSLFGGSKKTDFGAIYPEPPKLRVDDADIYLKQIDSIINDYEGIRSGTNSFNAVKYVFEPQEALVNREYGINTAPGDTYGAKSGALQRLQNSLNQRGILDSGTAGLLESQVEADRIRQLAGLFGDAKNMERQEYFDALGKLEQLFPQRFEVRNIPNVVNYMNDVNSYNVASQRNAATEGDRLQRLASESQLSAYIAEKIFGDIGTAVGSYFGNSSAGSQIGKSVGEYFSANAERKGDEYLNRASYFGNGGGGGINAGGGGGGLGSIFSSLFGGSGGNGGGSFNTSGSAGSSLSLNQRLLNQSQNGASSYRIPFQSASSKSSLVSSDSPGMRGVGGGMDFSSLLSMFSSFGGK